MNVNYITSIKDYHLMYINHKKNIYMAKMLLTMIDKYDHNYGNNPDLITIKDDILNCHPKLKQERLI